MCPASVHSPAAYPGLVSVSVDVTGVENGISGLCTASSALGSGGMRWAFSGFDAWTADSRQCSVPVRLCWIPTAFGLMTIALRVRQWWGRRIRFPPRILLSGSSRVSACHHHHQDTPLWPRGRPNAISGRPVAVRFGQVVGGVRPRRQSGWPAERSGDRRPAGRNERFGSWWTYRKNNHPIRVSE